MTSKVNLKTFIPIIFLILGIWVSFYPIILSNFDLFWADDTDGLLHIYLLEHNLSFFLHKYPHLSLFSPPFFYPDKNVLLYSDPYISATPFYAFFRLFLDEKNSFTFLLMLIMSLDFGSFFLLLKNKFKLNVFSSSLGAYVFTFSLYNQLQLTINHHSQMVYLFFVVISLYALLSVNKHNTFRQNCFWVFIFYLFIVLSVYSVYAITWYYCFSLVMFMVSMLFFKRPRRKLIIFIKRFGKLFVAWLLPAIMMLFPLVKHYLQFNLSWGEYSANTAIDFLKNYGLYSLIVRDAGYDSSVIEYNGGVEYFLLLLGLWGLYYFKRFRGVFFLFLLLLFLLSTNFNNMHLWWYIFQYFPGANGIRMNGRIIIIFYSVMAFGCAILMNDLCKFEKHKIRNSLYVLFISSVLCFLQTTYIPKIVYWGTDIYDTISTTSIMVDIDKYSKLIKENNCKIISLKFLDDEEKYPEFLVDILNMKAMWLAEKNKVYTLNGYSGYKPGEPSRQLNADEETVVCRFKYDW